MAEPTTASGGTKETIESIVIALIIAFVFRTFVLEAFVIPTGSMAPTLMGAHCRMTCPNCGWTYDINAGGVQQGNDIVIERRTGETLRVYCPNCGYQDDSERRDIFYGDRILVLKYAYLLQPPKRWDVVVFKSPTEPKRYDYQQNYIKRLVGNPGEQLMLLDGDLYITRATAPHDSDWQIQQKPDVVQDSLWRIVHDMDHAALGLRSDGTLPQESSRPAAAENHNPWKSAPGGFVETRDATGALAFEVQAAAVPQRLRFDPSVSFAKRPLTDWMAYDQNPDRQRQTLFYPIGDLKLSLFYQREAGDGELRLHLGKRDDLFIVSIARGKVSLLHQKGSDAWTQTELQSKPIRLPDRPVRLDFINLDYRVRLLVDGQEVLSTTPQQYHPDVTALRAEPEPDSYSTVYITAQQQSARLTHMSLWRDIYYSTPSNIFRGSPARPVKLGPDEYFVLGDNSPLSLDGRYWDPHEPVNLPAEDVKAEAGIVPGRFLLGKAIFVYWPAGFRPFAASPVDLIPNFGEMRFIH